MNIQSLVGDVPITKLIAVRPRIGVGVAAFVWAVGGRFGDTLHDPQLVAEFLEWFERRVNK